MKIREKTMAIVGVTFIFLFVLLVIATDQIVGNSFEQLENKEVSRNMGRAVEALSTKLESLNLSVSDYAVWDGSYRFVQGHDESYINETYGADAVTSLDVNMILYYDSRNKLYYATAVEKGTTKHENVSNAMLDFIASNELLFSHPIPNSHVSGIINSPEGPLLIASHAITQSSGEEPVVGTLIFAKHFDDKVIKELAETTHLSLSVEPLNKERAASYASDPSSPSRQDNSFNINYISEASVIGTKVMNDINGNPVLSLNLEMPRDTYQEGRSAIKYTLITILFMGLLFELVLAFSLDKSVLSRISSLNTNLKVITEKGSLSSRIKIEGEDEICDLTGNINHMLKTLEEKEEILETFDIIESSLESMNAGVMIAGMNSRVIMNNKFIEMWGISANLLPQKSAEKIIEHVIAQAGDGKGGTLKLKELKSASDRDQVTLYLRNNGAVYDWYAGPLLQHGKMIGTVYCTTDVTSVKLRAIEEENRKRLETIFSRIISGVLLIDAETSVIVEANPIAEEMIGLPQKEIVGNSCHNFLCHSAEGKCPIRDLGMKVDRSECMLLNKNGKKIPILKSVVPITLSSKEYLIESFVDMTIIKEAEESMSQAKLAAETANRAKSEFLAIMSHELRTPLNSIIGFSDLIIGGNAGEITPVQKKFLGNISTSGKHLLALINNILDMSKIEAGKMELNSELFAVKDLFTEVEQLISPLVEKKGLKVEFYKDEKLTTIYADKVRFKQIFFNLASNAIKFTPAGGKITISSKLKGEMAQFTVTDTGIGISEEDKQKLFKPFTQIDSTSTRTYEGTGLGLSLVKKFVELHGGNISCESEVGKGTIFVFEIPLGISINKEATS